MADHRCDVARALVHVGRRNVHREHGVLASPAGEIPPTNRRLTGRGVQALRVQGDAVVETQLYFDQVQLMTQLGLMPETAQPAGV